VDLGALRRNFALVRAQVAPEARVLAVVKADGYGHGASLVAPTLAAAGADWFGVATVEEALELRGCDIRQPILILAGAGRGDVATLIENDLRVALLDREMAHDLACAASGRMLPVHLKLDTGMGRLGTREAELPAFLEVITRLGCFAVEGVFSHFANADRVDRELSNAQVAAFHAGLGMIRGAGFTPRWIHLANSAAALTRRDVHFRLVRPGIVLYGVAPSGTAAPAGLEPVMRLESRLLQIKEVPAGVPLSYGQTFVTPRPTRYAVVPIGYADGYARALSNRAVMLVGGRRVPVIGAVCMDLTLVDITEVPEAQVGDPVVLWGRQGNEEITVGEVGQWQGSVDYEVLTRLGRRVPRCQQG